MVAFLAFCFALLPAADVAYDEAVARCLIRTLPFQLGLEQGAMPPPGDRLLFEDALASPEIPQASVGLLDVYVYPTGAFEDEREAERTLERAVAGLRPVAELLDRRFTAERGVLSGQRFPVVLAHADPLAEGDDGFDELVALLDWCEDDFTSWTRESGPLWTPASRDALAVRNWEVLLVNLAHPDAQPFGEDFLDHGVGYQVIAHLVNRLLRKGAWGGVPSWLSQGLIDEIDIEAYGQAWVGSDTYDWELEGWYREGWSGFLPTGARPPPTPTGPPADRARTVVDTSDPWDSRKKSAERHWDVLVDDRGAEHAASFAYMITHSGFLPRDRAYSRATLFTLLEVVPEVGEALLAALDRDPGELDGGLTLADGVPVIVSDALGGVGEVDRLESLSTEELLQELGRDDLIRQFRTLGGTDALALSDHRAQAEWLQMQPDIPPDARAALFDLFLTVEFYQQEREWESIARVLDEAMAAALEASSGFPGSDRSRSQVAAAVHAALP